MSNRITNSMLTGSTLNDVNAALTKLERNARELSSGRSILEPSDNPYGASRALDLQSQLDGLSSYTASVKDGISWTDAAGGAMQNMSEVLQRVRELVLEAANGTTNGGDMKQMGTVVTQLTEAIKQDANTQYAGQYVFSGTQTSTAPYAMGAGDEYHGDATLVGRAIGPGATVTVGTNLAGVLGNGSEAKDGKLLDVLRTIARHLGEGTPEGKAALTGEDLKGLDSGIEGLTQLQSVTGSATQQLQMAESRIEALQTSVEQTLSNTQDTDVAQATIAYSNQQAAYQAALRAGANIVQESLLNFLH